MNGIYEAAALSFRFWFLIVGIIVLFGAAGISIREYREKKYVLSVAQRSIGYISIVSGPDEILAENIQLMQTNTIGRSRRVDIVFRDRSIEKAHSQVYMSDDGSVYVNRLGRGEVAVNGMTIDDSAVVYSGDIICFGNIVTELYLKEELQNDS